MMAERDYTDCLQDIQDAILDIFAFTQGLDFDSFVGDKKTLYAVIRALEIIGEATKKIPASMKKNFPDIPWKEMAGFRDKLIHEYFGSNTRVVWNTVTDDIPGIQPLIADLVKKEG